MTDPEDLITAIFTLFVGLVVLAALFQVYTGGSVARVSEIAGTVAIPFVLVLVGFYVVLIIIENV